MHDRPRRDCRALQPPRRRQHVSREWSQLAISKLTSFPGKLPPAFQDLAHWDNAGVASPYGLGFAVEALLSAGQARSAPDLVRAVGGTMADRSGPDYSGTHWEAMDGWPFNHGVSLTHSWSTWPVFFLPRYLAGVYPRAPS